MHALLQHRQLSNNFLTWPLCRPQDNPITGRKADVIKAAHLCAEAALRLVKPGNQVTLFPFPIYWLAKVVMLLELVFAP